MVNLQFRQFISVVGISAPQSFSIMDLQRCCIHILPPLSGDMQVHKYFNICVYLLLTNSRLINHRQNYCIYVTSLSSLADVVVHRLLAASLGIYKLPNIFQDRPQLTSIADSKTLNCFRYI